MYGTLTSAALLGLSAFASALPHRPAGYPGTGSNSSSGGQVDFKFPLANGFPNVTGSNLLTLEQQADGTLPNATAPVAVPTATANAVAKPLSNDSIISLGFIAFNEIFEVAFFTELVSNITNKVPGYEGVSDTELANLKVIVAQEELHALNANGGFAKNSGLGPILPCEYIFPVDNFLDAIALASTFTDVVLSTLPDIQTLFGENGDNSLIRGVGSVIGQEGEQNGFYRGILGKVPSALPFLTAGARNFPFNAILQSFVVPGSCPNINLLEPTLLQTGILNVLVPPTEPVDQEVQFSFSTAKTVGNELIALPPPQESGLFMTYINQQNAIFSVPLTDLHFDANTNSETFSAFFPGQAAEMNGLTIAAITNSNGPFASPDDVAAATQFGPGLIEIN